MAEECTGNFVPTTLFPLESWMPDPHTTWNMFSNPWNQQNESSNSSCEDVSMSTSYTNQSGLTIDSTCRLLDSASMNEQVGETATDDNFQWSQVLISRRANHGDSHNNQEAGENMFDACSTRDMTAGLLFNDPPCPADYLKKLDNMDFMTYLNNTGKQFEPQTLNDPCLRNISSTFVFKHPFYDQNQSSLEMKVDDKEIFPSLCSIDHDRGTDFRIGNSMISCDTTRRYHSGLLPDALWNDSRVLSFPSYLNKPLIDINSSDPILKTLNLPDCKNLDLASTSLFPSTKSTFQTLTKGSNVRKQENTREGKKKRSEESSETAAKKPKHETSADSSPAKTQVPKVKLAEKITALQQLVSPFGKTDTASVLWETIGYIGFLQEQIQLLISNLYVKSNTCKDPWEKKEGGNMKDSLRSRGLCLIPSSSVPQMYHEASGSADYFTPSYRGSLYR